MKTISELLTGNAYPGRGILVGTSADGKRAVFAYFIMGRSENSRNRIFKRDGDSLFTRPFDESKVKDPALIIYRAARFISGGVIVTNGDQTDTIYEALSRGDSFESALLTRTYEPDAPNYTPRISAILHTNGGYRYTMSILRRDEATGDCERAFWEYPSEAGVGRLIHTYVTDGDPLPSFRGEPKAVSLPNDPRTLAVELWRALDEKNKISLYVSFVDIASGETDDVLINKNQPSER